MTSLGEDAYAGTLHCNRLLANNPSIPHEITGDLQIDGRLTQKGAADFEKTVTLTSTADLEANGEVKMANASIFMFGIPTTDPAVAGRLFRTGTDLKVSLG
tara:strand:+ start:6229 stop:6531 length:303 start_codon:yes stop_codon:yes gene_type:complete